MSSGYLPEGIREFYKDKEVIVVGGAGFIGQQLARLLVLAGAGVLVVDNFSRGRKKIEGVQYKRIDVGTTGPHSFTLMERFSRADVVFNLAATVAGVLHNQKNHLSMYQNNVAVLAGPLKYAETAKVPVYLQTSSVCVYAPEYNSPSVESLGMKGVPHPANAGYAEAKRDGERMARWSSEIDRVVIVRPSNVAGPGDYFDDLAHVVPAFVKRAFEGSDEFVLYGDPHATREFIHPMDVANGMMYAAAFGEHKEAYNIGCNGENTISIKDLADKVINEAQEVAQSLGFSLTRPELRIDTSIGGGDAKRYSDSSKLNALGWEHDFSLETIIEHCVEDYAINHYEKK